MLLVTPFKSTYLTHIRLEYFQRLKDHDTRANAYWSVEHDHMSIFGRTRYNGHEVFATVLSRWNTKRRSDL